MEHSDCESPKNIDDGDENTCDGIASHEFTGTIHRAIEVGFFLDFESARCGGDFIDDSGIELGIDGHLFSRHRVECESSGHLRNTPCTFRDNDEVDNHQNNENDGSNEVVALDEHIAKSFDHMTCIAVQKDKAGGCNIQRQP